MARFQLFRVTLVNLVALALFLVGSGSAAEEVNYVVGRVILGVGSDAGTEHFYGPMRAEITQSPHSDQSFLVDVDSQGYFVARVNSISVPYRVKNIRYQDAVIPAFNSQVFAFYRFRQNSVGQSGYSVNLMDVGETTLSVNQDQSLSCHIYLNRITLKLNQLTRGGTDTDASYDITTSSDKSSYPASDYYATHASEGLFRDAARISLWANKDYCDHCTYEVRFLPEGVWPFSITLEK